MSFPFCGQRYLWLVRWQVDRRDAVDVIAEKRPPALRRWPRVAAHVPSDRRLGDLEAELEQLTMNTRRAPKCVRTAHLAIACAAQPRPSVCQHGCGIARANTPETQHGADLFTLILGILASRFKARATLEAENLVLRHVVGLNATEIIHEMLLAKSSELLSEDLAGMIHAHPTLSEGIREAAKGIHGKPIHL